MTKPLTLGEILTRPVVTLNPNASVSLALDTMREQHISAIVIVDKNQPVGIFTERDAVMMAFNKRDIDKIPLKQVMSTTLVTAPVSLDYRDAYRLINQHHVRHLIVTEDDGSLVGILSEYNFLHHLGNEFLVRFKEVGALMTENVICLPSDVSVNDVVKLMAHDRISCVVIESRGLAQGIFTERDLIKLDIHSPHLLDAPITQYMSSPVMTIKKTENLPNAIVTMDNHMIRRLVVVDERDNIIGLITRSDIVRQLYDRHIEQLQKLVRDRESELAKAREKLRLMNELFQTKQVLEDKQIKLQLALEAGKIFTWDWDVQKNLIFTDNRMTDFFSVQSQDIEKGVALEQFLQAIDKDDHNKIYTQIQHALDTGNFPDIDFKISYDSDTLYFTTRGQTITNRKGEVIRITGVMADVSSDRKYLIRLEEIQNNLLEAQRLAKIGNWEMDTVTRQAFWSDEIFLMFGYSADTRISAEFVESIVHEADWPGVKRSLQQAISDDKKHELEYRIFSADGFIHWVYCKAENIKDKNGKVIKLKGILQDITERKNIDEKLRLSSTVFENSLEGILITDVKGNIVEVNPAFSSITGYSRQEIIGRDTSIFKSGHHDDEFYKQMWQSLQDSGQWQGEIWNRRKDGSVYPEWENISSVEDDRGSKSHYVSVFSDISQIKNSQIELDYLAHHDALTDLPNRLLLNERLNQAIRHARRIDSKLAIFFLDLDNFKHINDSLGHPTGDSLLKNVTEKLLQSVRQDDTVARIGGDEFVILLEDIGKPENAILMAEKLLAIFQNSFALENHQIGITASLGICLYPEDGEDAETLLRNADSAMYLAKTEGRNTYQFYTAELTRNAFERVLLENSLRLAIDRNEFLLYYQPQWRLDNLTIIGVEALIRWQHPDLGLVSPAKFIPIAEDSGLILTIGKWVINEACRQGKQWLDRGYKFGRIAVNVSGPQLQRGKLVDDITSALVETELPAHYLEIEVTEGFIMQQAKDAITQLNELRNMGITISIDDFGTGYSSLSYLKQLPVQKLKIDQSFVRDIPRDANDMAIADAVIAMGKSLALTVIAEGVETEEQSDFLKKCGCQEAQGFLYSRPLAVADLNKLFD